jgi:hypothetical protein
LSTRLNNKPIGAAANKVKGTNRKAIMAELLANCLPPKIEEGGYKKPVRRCSVYVDSQVANRAVRISLGICITEIRTFMGIIPLKGQEIFRNGQKKPRISLVGMP